MFTHVLDNEHAGVAETVIDFGLRERALNGFLSPTVDASAIMVAFQIEISISEEKQNGHAKSRDNLEHFLDKYNLICIIINLVR